MTERLKRHGGKAPVRARRASPQNETGSKSAGAVVEPMYFKWSEAGMKVSTVAPVKDGYDEAAARITAAVRELNAALRDASARNDMTVFMGCIDEKATPHQFGARILQATHTEPPDVMKVTLQWRAVKPSPATEGRKQGAGPNAAAEESQE